MIIYIFMLTGCLKNETAVEEARVLIGGGAGMDFCLIDINADGTVEYISGNMKANYNIREKNIFSEGYKKKTIRLSNEDKLKVNKLVKKVVSNEPVEEVYGDGNVIIWALINDVEYLSNYYKFTISTDYDENLAKLCYKLVELAPLKVGGKMNPLEVPEEYK